MTEIIVTTKDIQAGKRGSLSSCPLTIALKRAYKRTDIFVLADYLQIGDFVIEAPKIVQEFIRDYDRRLPVRTISFKLEELK